MKKVLTFIIFPILIVYLGYILYASIQEPVQFESERSSREKIAIERLKNIRTLQEAYKTRYGKFTSSLDTLLNFYSNDSIVVVRQVGSFDDSLAVAEKRVYRDTINILVRDTLLRGKFDQIDSLRLIPFSGGDTIFMKAVIKPVSGVLVPLFEAYAPFEVLLRGMDKQLIINLKTSREDTDRYPGLKVGDINAPNNNAGNWE